jgi:hypothetical protein
MTSGCFSHVDATSFRVMRQRLRASGLAASDPRVFVLMPAFVVAVTAAEVLGRLRGHHDPVPAEPDSAAPLQGSAMDYPDDEWQRKGAPLSDKTARKESGGFRQRLGGTP